MDCLMRNLKTLSMSSLYHYTDDIIALAVPAILMILSFNIPPSPKPDSVRTVGYVRSCHRNCWVRSLLNLGP